MANDWLDTEGGDFVFLYLSGTFLERFDTTTDICIHPNRVIVASGQSTCHQRERNSEFELRNPIVSSVDFENDNDNFHTEGANDQIFAASWHPSIKNLIVTCGKGHLSFWTFDSRAGTLTKNPAGRDKPKTLIAMCFTKTGDVIIGDSNGTLSLWNPITFKIKKQANAVHPGGITALCINRKGRILSAGKDRIIAEWETSDLVRRRRPIELPDDAGIPRVMCNAEGDKVIVGTSRNSLFAGDFGAAFEEIIDGDFDDVTCCVAVQSHLFITASADGGIRQYNTSTKRREWRKNYGEGVTCISINTVGSHLALGFCGGSWSIMDLSTKDMVVEQKESMQPITAIQFSPNGALLFIATKELSAMIYRFDNSHQCHRIARIANISSFVVALDWDVDSQYIRANSSIEHIYHWSSAGELVDYDTVRDLKWASCNCRISFEAGCIAHSVEGITSISCSTSLDKLVIGRDNGSVRLYSYPVKSTCAGFHALGGHSHTISAVAFTDSCLITAGLIDSTLYQWRL